MTIAFFRRAACKVLLPLALAGFSTCAFGTVIEQDFNAGIQQASNTYFGIPDVGWYYTPSSSYSLVGLDTIFTQSTNANDVNRNVTIGIYTDRPALGGTLLGAGTFNSASARGTYGGATFSGISLIAGDTYFIGFSDVLDLGVNQVSFATSNSGPAGSVSPGFAYVDSGDGTYSALAGNGTVSWFDKPVLRFLGPDPITTAAPEPATWMLGGAPILGLFLLHRLRRNRQ